MKRILLLGLLAVLLSACLGDNNKTPVNVVSASDLTETYYDTEGRLGSSWMVQSVGDCKFEVLMDANSILYMLYSADCQVVNAGRGIRVQPEGR